MISNISVKCLSVRVHKYNPDDPDRFTVTYKRYIVVEHSSFYDSVEVRNLRTPHTVYTFARICRFLFLIFPRARVRLVISEEGSADQERIEPGR